MKKLTLIFFTVFLSGCTILALQGRGPRPLILNQPNEEYEVIRHFEIDKDVFFDYTRAPDISSMVSTLLEETKADALINLHTTARATFVVGIVNLFTLGIANGYNVQIEGDAVRWKSKDKP